MKKLLVLSVVALLGFSSCGGGGSTKMKSDVDTVSYALGLTELAPYVQGIGAEYDLNTELVLQAIRDFINEKPKLTQEEAGAFLQEYFMVRMPLNNLKEAEDFLAGIEKQANIQKTASGLMYEIIEAGGAKATNDADTVRVIYKGTLPDGTVFDSTEQQGGEPAVFPLNRVIPAWTEGMKLVGEGGKVKLYVHPDIGYGAQGYGNIKPNSALVFEVELLEVMPVTE